MLKDFTLDDSKTELEFPTTLSNTERKSVHALAEEFGLSHFSKGSKIRYIPVEKKENVKIDEWHLFG